MYPPLKCTGDAKITVVVRKSRSVVSPLWWMCAACVSRRPPWPRAALKQIENIRCFNSAVARLRNSGQTGPGLHAHIMFMWKVRAKLIGSTRGSKAMNWESERARRGASAKCYKPVARRRVCRGQEQPSGVR